MGADTKIEWCDHTANTWWGCTKVSAGCAHCYAEGEAKRFGQEVWGNQNSRRQMKGVWQEVRKWAVAAASADERRRVFWGSMMDVAEDRPELIEPRKRFCGIIEELEGLDFLILTKRPENYIRLMPWGAGPWPRNAWAGTSVENQELLDERAPALMKVKAAIRWLSCEPLLGPLCFHEVPFECEHEGGFPDPETGVHECSACENATGLESIDWAIVGGESGGAARPFDLAWAASIIEQCHAAEIPAFVKQLGSKPYIDHSPQPAAILARKYGIGPLVAEFLALKDRKGGDMDEWPKRLRVREFPR